MDARGRVCDRHQRYVQPGEACPHCETIPRGSEVLRGAHNPTGSGSSPDSATNNTPQSSYHRLSAEIAVGGGIMGLAARLGWPPDAPPTETVTPGDFYGIRALCSRSGKP